jgi:hypothetical protein
MIKQDDLIRQARVSFLPGTQDVQLTLTLSDRGLGG